MTNHFKSRDGGVARPMVVGLVLVAVVSLVAPAAAVAAHVSHRHPPLRQARGLFEDSGLTVSNVQITGPTTATFDGTGGTHWTGFADGDTTYTGSGTVDLVTGEVNMTMHETFVGSVDGYGSGTIHFLDHLYVSNTNDITHAVQFTDCMVVGGEGDFVGMAGWLRFQSTAFDNPGPNGEGPSSGFYFGRLLR